MVFLRLAITFYRLRLLGKFSLSLSFSLAVASLHSPAAEPCLNLCLASKSGSQSVSHSAKLPSPEQDIETAAAAAGWVEWIR